jgi:ESF2/ABP1 family protein
MTRDALVGWVEFENKKIARQVAESLNNTIIGGKKSNIYHDDIWNIKYLKNFKYAISSIYLASSSSDHSSHCLFIIRWDYLTEKVAYERRIREKKLAAAMLEVRFTYLTPLTPLKLTQPLMNE